MNKRKLGSTGFEVAPLAFGGNVFGWTADEPTSFAKQVDELLAATRLQLDQESKNALDAASSGAAA